MLFKQTAQASGITFFKKEMHTFAHNGGQQTIVYNVQRLDGNCAKSNENAMGTAGAYSTQTLEKIFAFSVL